MNGAQIPQWGSRLQQACSGIIVVLALAACSPPSSDSRTGAEPERRPNILYILADDMGYADLGAFGSEIPTPNLDALASNGMLLTDFYAGMTCSPTRAMLMSGMDHHLAGLALQGATTRPDHLGKPGYEGYLNFRVVSLADLMSDAGYNTYMTGKWHIGEDEEQGPKARGFKRSFVSIDGAAHLGGWDWRGPQPARYRDNGRLVQVGDDWYTTRDYTKKMIEYIDEGRAEDKPFFAWLAYTAPHWPLQAPKESIAKFKGWYDDGYEALYAKRLARQKELGLVPATAGPIDDSRFSPRWSALSAEQKRFESRRMEIYAAMVSDLDRYVGEIVDYLKRTGQFDNTLVMFMSDNGAESARRDLAPPIADHIGKEYDHSLENLGSATSYVMYGANWASVGSTPFNRFKFTAFEGGAHVPAFVHFPKLVKPGSRSDGVGTVRDLLPTFLELAGGSLPGTTYKGREVLPVQGRSLLPMLKGEVAETHPADQPIGFELLGHRGLRQGDWKIVWDHAEAAGQRRWRLFNLASDPWEQQDVSAAQPAMFAELQQLWDRYAAESGIIY